MNKPHYAFDKHSLRFDKSLSRSTAEGLDLDLRRKIGAALLGYPGRKPDKGRATPPGADEKDGDGGGVRGQSSPLPSPPPP